LAPITVETAGQVSGLAAWYEPSVADLAWTPDGRNLAVATTDLIHLYDVLSRQVLRALYPTSQGIVDIAFNPSGTWLIAGSRRGSEQEGFISGLELWLGPNWQPKGVLYGTERPLSSLAFSPDDQYLAVAYSGPPWQQSSIDFWSPLTWVMLDQMDTGAALNVAISPDGRLMAVTPDRYAIRVYDRVDKKRLYNLHTSFTGAVNALAFSPDGFTLASGHYDGMVRLWDMRNGMLLLEFPSGAVVQSLAFSPDGRMIATGGSFQDSLVRLWSVGSGELLRALEGHTGGVTSLVFSPDRQYLVSASYDGSIYLWGMRP
jgi:WD40 repeat protein